LANNHPCPSKGGEYDSGSGKIPLLWRGQGVVNEKPKTQLRMDGIVVIYQKTTPAPPKEGNATVVRGKFPSFGGGSRWLMP
jgi:hypothetical protein